METNERSAWPLVKVQWSECQVGFDCLCGSVGLFIDEEPVTCDICGRVYRLVASFTVKEPTP